MPIPTHKRDCKNARGPLVRVKPLIDHFRTTLAILLLLVFFSVASAFIIPIENGIFCRSIVNSAGGDFAEFGFMVIAGTSTFALGAMLAVVIVFRSGKQQLKHSRVLLLISLVLFVFPVTWSAVTAIHAYNTCPGSWRTLTPEQQNNLKYGSLTNEMV